MPTEQESHRSRQVRLLKRDGDDEQRVTDMVAAEEPLEIRLGDRPLAVVMRTPGDDDDLVTGFLLTEGILLEPAEIRGIERLDDSRVSVVLADGVDVDPARFQRNLFVSSSCGVCGKASIEAVQLLARPIPAARFTRALVADLTTRLRTHQPTFDATGGLHAAGIIDQDGNTLGVREDVGRHNAADKVIGHVAALHWPLPPSLLVVSGRQSFEIVQKAAVTGITGVVGVSAPSSLAVELAEAQGMLLVGFARGSGFNVYAGEDRLGT